MRITIVSSLVERRIPRLRRRECQSSQQCPKCDYVVRDQKDIINHPDYHCPNCGWQHCDRDIKAGLTLLLWQYLDGGIDWGKLPKELKDICRSLDRSERKVRLKNILAMRKNALQGRCEKDGIKGNTGKPDQTRVSKGKKKKPLAHGSITCFQLKLPL